MIREVGMQMISAFAIAVDKQDSLGVRHVLHDQGDLKAVATPRAADGHDIRIAMALIHPI